MTLLQRLARRFASWRVYLYIDGAGWHKGDPVEAFLADHPQFDLEYLPSYHLELNPVDRLWKVLRHEATTILENLW